MNYIRFPYLWGLEFHINPVAFSIGNLLNVTWYGLVIAVAFLVAAVLAFRSCSKHGIKPDDLIDYVIFTLPAAIIGARLYYVIFAPNATENYWSKPLEILKIWNGGLAIYGAIIAIPITVLAVAWYKKQNFLTILDYAMPYVLLGQAIGRWGNFFNQEAFGANTINIFGMTGNRIKLQLEYFKAQGGKVTSELPVHPTFLYESLWCLAGFFLLLYLRKHKKNAGEIVLLYFIIYGIGRFLIEGLRLDSLMVGNIRISQLISGILVVLASIAYVIIHFRKSKAERVQEALEKEKTAQPESDQSNDEISLDDDSDHGVAQPDQKDTDKKDKG